MEIVAGNPTQVGPTSFDVPYTITVTSTEFSDVDGGALLAELDGISSPLGAEAFALSPGSPNPFRSSMSFTVTLPANSGLEVSVFDLGGRRVTTLHRGNASAGTHPFRWNGTDANGARVRGGVYFIRAQAADQLISRKAVLIGGQ